MWCSWVVLASGLKSRHRSRFDKLLLCCFWIAPVEPSKATYGSSHLVAAGWACDKWQWWLHGQDWRICVHFKYTLWKGASSKSQHCGGPVNCQKKKKSSLSNSCVYSHCQPWKIPQDLEIKLSFPFCHQLWLSDNKTCPQLHLFPLGHLLAVTISIFPSWPTLINTDITNKY